MKNDSKDIFDDEIMSILNRGEQSGEVPAHSESQKFSVPSFVNPEPDRMTYEDEPSLKESSFKGKPLKKKKTERKPEKKESLSERAFTTVRLPKSQVEAFNIIEYYWAKTTGQSITHPEVIGRFLTDGLRSAFPEIAEKVKKIFET